MVSVSDFVISLEVSPTKIKKELSEIDQSWAEYDSLDIDKSSIMYV